MLKMQMQGHITSRHSVSVDEPTFRLIIDVIDRIVPIGSPHLKKLSVISNKIVACRQKLFFSARKKPEFVSIFLKVFNFEKKVERHKAKYSKEFRV